MAPKTTLHTTGQCCSRRHRRRSCESYEYSQKAETPESLKEFRKRARIEPKNAELKRIHVSGKGYGLRSIRIQAKLTSLAHNLKRITKLVSALQDLNNHLGSCCKADY